MRTRHLIALLAMFFFLEASSQTCPPNLDFEDGTFTNWQCYTGTTFVNSSGNVISLTPSTPVPNRHEIITASSGATNDPYGRFPRLCPYGGSYSVKLGNEAVGAQAEGLSYTFQVPTSVDTFTFTYFYAVVFQDPQHSREEQPRFFVTAYDVATGALINCASYDYVANGSIPGFQVSPVRNDVLYKDWTPTSLQFAGMAGRTVRLEFKTADCTLGGHFGYAYIDVASACSNILATAPYCVETNSLILNAPYGFQSYTWYNSNYTSVVGTGQSLTLSPPPVTSGSFWVDLVPYPGYGCRDTLQAIVTPLPIPDTPVAQTLINLCQFQSANPLTATATPGHQLVWYTTPTGGTGSTTAPTPPTSTPGVFKYYVAQKALFGCEGFRREITVNVYQTPVASFNINNTRQCQNGNSFIFRSTSTNLNNASYTWEFGDGQSYTSTDTFAIYSYTTAGTFTVRLKATNANTCTAERTQSVTVIPKPTASFTYPSLICEHHTTVTLNNTSSVPGGVATINNWWWNIGGQIVQTQNPAPFTAGSGGTLPVQLVVTTSEGCRSDTNKTSLDIRYGPKAQFKIGDLLCNNEMIRFTDQSTLPPGATAESITKWYWTFDNTNTSLTQNPTTYFTAGMHNAKLAVETNVGCRSLVLDSTFEIYPKPQIQLNISDSCVFVPIVYSANDMAGNVSTWYWDFGTGLNAGPSSVTKSYPREGNKPFTVMTLTNRGCKDTILRPFTIYDNKSFAGRDTVAARDEPVQLFGRGEPGMTYSWSPSIGLNDATIENPIATLDRDQLYKLNTVTEKGCKKETQIMIKRYNGPELYIPTAFTPNGDGKNDFFKVVPIGIKSFGYLAVYNRHGQLVYKTTNFFEGWDGTYRGVELGTGTFVYIAEAVDYKGRKMFRKGTVTLIR